MNKDKENVSKIIGIQFSILSPEEIRKSSVAHISSRNTYENNKPVIGGLFDPRMGVLDPGLICPTDGLNYMTTPGYFGHLELARPVFYIQYLSTIIKILRCTCIKCSKLLIRKEKWKHLLKKKGKARWDRIFKLASKITRCGEENENGCGTKQPSKIYKEGLATIYAEWIGLESPILPHQDVDIEPVVEGVPNKIIQKLIPEIVLKIFRRISDEDVTFMGFSPIWSRPDWMVCQVLAIPPPAVRPSIKHDSQQRSEDDISHIIVNIIKSNKTLLLKMQQDSAAKVIDDWTTVLQYYIATMVDNKIPGVASVAQRSGRALKSLKERLVGKQGRVRGNLMGKRVDYSARSVITPDPNLSIRELGVPIDIAMNITYPICVNKRNQEFLSQLVINGPSKYPGAKILERKTGEQISLARVDRNSITINLGDIIHRHMLDGDIVLFNRQPTLHRMSMMGHYAKVMKVGSTFRMNVGDTKPYNADFDGDEMNLHNPQDDEARAELRGLAAVAHQIISPANNKSIVGIFQDSLLGANRLTRPNIVFTQRQAMNLLMSIKNLDERLFKIRGKDVTSFEILSQIFPPMSAYFKNNSYDDSEAKQKSNNIIEIVNGKYIRGQMDKSTFGGSKGLIQSIFNDFSDRDSADFIDDLQNIVTEYMKQSAYSVGISDLIADAKTNDAIIDAITKKKQDVVSLINQTHIGVFENNTGKSNEEEFETRVNTILNNARDDAGKIGRKNLSAHNRFQMMVNAGSKGSTINIVQMISCLGQQNVDGKRIPYGFDNRTLPHFTKYDDSALARGFVENSFMSGLSPTELFFHAQGGRIGLIDTAVKTSQTGYIQRRLVKGLEDLQVKYDMTVRNNKNRVIQFRYGDDCIDPIKVENQSLPLVKMTIEEIYAHFQIPTENLDDIFITNYTPRVKKKMKKKSEKDRLIATTQLYINDMLEARELLIKNVFNYENSSTIHQPVNFRRIIGNIQNQFNIHKDSMVNISPNEIYDWIDLVLNNLDKLTYSAPTLLFKIAFKFYLAPKELIVIRRFNKKAITYLFQYIEMTYKKAIAHPGEMVGIIAAQSLGEPTTQMTLNTFHFAGIASKSNVTRGVPRIEEILSLSENPKNPSVTVYLKEEDETNKQKARELMHTLEYTNLRDITRKVGIYFDPDDSKTLLVEDKLLMEQFNEFSKIVADCAEQDKSVKNKSKWILRFEFDTETMLDKNISMDDVHFAIKNSYKDNLFCIYTDLNDNNLVLRIRLKIGGSSKKMKLLIKKQKSLDQTDEIHIFKNLQENLLNNIILRGVQKIPKVIIRKVPGRIIKKNGNYINEEGWVLDTVGTNLLDILALDGLDEKRTYSNSIREIHKVLGIEAARQAIYNEFGRSFKF